MKQEISQVQPFTDFNVTKLWLMPKELFGP